MADELIDVSADWAKRAYVDDAKYKAMYEASIRDPATFWGEHGKRVDWIKPYSDGAVRDVDYTGDVHIRWYSRRRAERLGQLPRPASGQARRPDGDHLGRRRSGQVQAHHLSRAARRSLPHRQRAEGARRQEGRPRHHLHADDPRGGHRHARLRAHRRHPLGRVRRLLARQPRRPHRRLRQQHRHHRRRGPARRQAGAAQGQRRRGARRRRRGVKKVLVVRHTGGKVAMDAGRDVWWHEIAAKVASRLPARADGRRGPAVHPLHLRLDRQAQGRAAHDRRLPGVRLDDAPSTSSTITTTTSTGAPPTSAGSPATATSSTARSPTAPRR